MIVDEYPDNPFRKFRWLDYTACIVTSYAVPLIDGPCWTFPQSNPRGRPKAAPTKFEQGSDSTPGAKHSFRELNDVKSPTMVCIKEKHNELNEEEHACVKD